MSGDPAVLTLAVLDELATLAEGCAVLLDPLPPRPPDIDGEPPVLHYLIGPKGFMGYGWVPAAEARRVEAAIEAYLDTCAREDVDGDD